MRLVWLDWLVDSRVWLNDEQTGARSIWLNMGEETTKEWRTHDEKRNEKIKRDEKKKRRKNHTEKLMSFLFVNDKLKWQFHIWINVCTSTYVHSIYVFNMGDLYIRRILKNRSSRYSHFSSVFFSSNSKTSWNVHNNKIIVDRNLSQLIGALFPLHFVSSIYSQFFWGNANVNDG